MELLKRYKEEIGNDLLITDFNLKDIQLKLPSRKHFWAARLIDAKITLQNLHKRKKSLKNTTIECYYVNILFVTSLITIIINFNIFFSIVHISDFIYIIIYYLFRKKINFFNYNIF